MQTENTTTELALQEHVERLSASIERLNARIARLATALDVSLDKDSEVERVLQRETSAPGDTRQHRMREELRGLLVLRYGVTTRFTQKLGAEVTRDLFIYAEEKLLREGFRPGADGIDLRALEAEAA
ncbi:MULTISPECIES: hypothetical protein [Comamonas]|uniref:hypothetical protein n=1 Tax=Comamonas TaxID=283 RepID=UPI001C45352F|nr:MULTISPECIES: hypothetical protein [Comamonas]MBV7420727.1 hypothetical protein [Comamonas sp. CMM03]MDH1702358.1 hypothetical protein [Comamonas terrigena]MDI9856680.1 hypothetical protein [Comamonas sp. 17RB]